jgi:hypothetical protein
MVKTARQARDIFPSFERESESESRTSGVEVRGAAMVETASKN